MSRPAYGGRTTCESCKSIDVRRWHREGLLDPGRSFSVHWTHGGEPAGNIDFEGSRASSYLAFDGAGIATRIGNPRSSGYPLNGRRAISVAGGPGLHVPSIAGGGIAAGASRNSMPAILCSPAAIATVSLMRASRKARKCEACRKRRKIRERLGGSPNLLEPFPDKPPGMHWRTYNRLKERAEQAEQRSNVSMMEWLRKRELAPIRRRRVRR
jgi:hypothetical protein